MIKHSIFLFIFALIFSVNAIRYNLLNDEKYSKINEIKKYQLLIQKYFIKFQQINLNLLG